MKNRGGRPPLPAHLRRKHALTVMLTDQERQDLVEIARECNTAPSVYIRDHALMVARIQTGGAFWPNGDCPNPWHMYAHAGSGAASECPDCGALAPIIEQASERKYHVTLPS